MKNRDNKVYFGIYVNISKWIYTIRVYLVEFLNFNFFCDFSSPTSIKLVIFISTIGQIGFTNMSWDLYILNLIPASVI